MTSLFGQLEIEAFRNGIRPRSQQSMAWFRKKASQLTGNVNREELLRDEALRRTSSANPIGQMGMFFYDPKYKATLPYYDKFPLVVVVDPAKDGFYGINLHYLPLALRAQFLDKLLDVTNNKAYNESTKFGVSYALLKSTATLKSFKPCFKHYLTKHMRSHFARVLAPEYEIATFLPTASWSGATESQIHRDSRRMIS
jgi:hypothetical protein